MRTFEYHRPGSIDELLARTAARPDAALLCGGTDLMVRVRKGWLPPVVIDLKRVAGLSAEVTVVREGVRIGALTVMTDIIAAEPVQRHFHALADAAVVVGSVQIRNRATLAGNICNASPAADTAPALLVYRARVNVIGASGGRQVDIAEFFAGPGRTTLNEGEIVASIDLPFPPAPRRAGFSRLTRRWGVDLAIVSVCCTVDDAGRTALAAGAVAPRPVYVEADSEEDAVNRLSSAASPISDLRGSRDYRVAMLPIVARRALKHAR